MSVRPVPTYQQRISGRLVPAFINSLGYWSDRSCFQFSDSCPLRPILQAACILFLRAFCVFPCAFILAHFQCIFKFFLEILFRFYMQSLKNCVAAIIPECRKFTFLRAFLYCVLLLIMLYYDYSFRYFIFKKDAEPSELQCQILWDPSFMKMTGRLPFRSTTEKGYKIQQFTF